MLVFTDFASIPPDAIPPHRGSVVTIGNFDGVHRGHRVLLEAVRRAATQLASVHPASRLASAPEVPFRAVLTFEPHPMQVIAPAHAPVRVCPPAEKLALLQASGIDLVLTQRFDAAFSALSPDAFVQQVLVKALAARHVVVGYDFSYGRRRAGSIETLRASGAVHGFTVEEVSAQHVGALPASSSRVRAAVVSGAMHEAYEVLGRWFSLAGTVVEGHRRGRELGFPTANVATDWRLLPARGVYAGWLDWGQGPESAVINLGHNPTFGANAAPTIEAHVLGRRDLALYGLEVRLSFAERLRDERRFESVDALRAQIAADASHARAVLAGHTP
jgi:riboflavin kinase/FMN adenylyltransferase